MKYKDKIMSSLLKECNTRDEMALALAGGVIDKYINKNEAIEMLKIFDKKISDDQERFLLAKKLQKELLEVTNDF